MKKLEKVATKIGLFSVLVLTLVGFVWVFDIAFDLDIFSDSNSKLAAGILMGLLAVLAFSTVIISIMLNVKRIAEILDKSKVDN